MYRIDNATAITPIPAPAAVGPNPNSFFTKGNPGTGTPATIVDDDWANAVQEEICNVITGAGIVLSKTVRTQLLSAIQSFGRTRLVANTTFFVDVVNGNDANNGLAAGVGHAWATIAHAYSVLQASYDLCGFIATLQLADGTYPNTTLSGTVTGQGAGYVTLNGNAGTPSNVILQGFTSAGLAAISPQNLKIANPGGDGISAGLGGKVSMGNGIVFGACTGVHMSAFRGGVISRGNYTINGGANYHMQSSACGNIVASGITVTLSGVPAFASAFAWAQQLSIITDIGATYVGAATGARYSATENGAISTNGGGAGYFPGNSAGSTATGGQYN